MKEPCDGKVNPSKKDGKIKKKKISPGKILRNDTQEKMAVKLCQCETSVVWSSASFAAQLSS